MRVDIGNLNPATKFFFDEDKPEGGHVLLQALNVAQLKEVTKLCTKKTPPEYRRGIRYEVSDKVDEEKQLELLWDRCIVDWNGIEDTKGKPIPCNSLNKTKFMREWSWFALFIGNCLEQLNTDQAEPPKEAEIKNSSNSQSE
ncbi:MAG: hypothetical protein HQ568_00345 [Calditrichaeota bacterium]|nr:hypothetical protein [Calditrichota bacterium]